jgi:hypothetical protein
MVWKRQNISHLIFHSLFFMNAGRFITFRNGLHEVNILTIYNL